MTSKQLAILANDRQPLAPLAKRGPAPQPPPRRSLVRARLHGKLRWVIAAGGCGLLAGALLGALCVRPTYRAVASLEVQPVIAHAATAQADGRPTPAFQTFVQRQLPLLAGPDLQVTATALSPAQIDIVLLGPDPQIIAERLRTVHANYRASPDVAEQAAKAMELEQIIARRRTLEQQLLAARQQSEKAVDEVGPVSVEQALAGKAAQLSKIELQLTEANIALATLNAQASPDNERDAQDQRIAQLAHEDDILAAILARKQQLTQQYESMRHRMGENAPAMAQLREQLKVCEHQVAGHVAQSPTAQVRLVGLGVEGSISLTMDELLQRRSTLSGLRDQVAGDAGRLSRQKQQIAELHNAVEFAQSQIEQLNLQVEQLLAGGRAAGRVSEVSAAPTVAVHHDPRIRNAALGGTAGLLLGLGASLLLIIADQRILRADAAQIAGGSAPLLGKVPVMARDDGDPSHEDRAALCIHEIRALLEIRAQTGGAQAFAITSSGKGAGKTSLTVGLASSLALSGTRTLLVDCELTGRVTRAPAGDADRNSATSPTQPPQRLDEVMLLMGYLDEHDTDIFLLPEDARVGLVAMLDGDSLEQCVVHTSVPGLSILPAVSAQPHHIGKMSCHFIRRLIAEARQQYDMILFDTGPIPGSVEALFVASEVDEVILIVSRGELQNRVDKTIAHLKMIGAHLAGTVFNRAVAGDVGMKEQTPPPRSGQNPPPRRANHGQNMGSGIFAAAVHAHARTDTNPGGGVASENRSTPPPRPAEDDEAISPQDAGEMYRVLLRDEMDADEAASPQTPHRNEAKRSDGANAINDVLDDLLDNVIASAERKMDPHKSGTAAPAAPTNPKTS